MKKTPHYLASILMVLAISLYFHTSLSAQQYGVVFADNVNVRKNASSKSPLSGRIEKNLSLVEVTAESPTTEKIPFGLCSIDYTWHAIDFNKLITGWVYGAYILVFDTKDSAQQCINQNNAFRAANTGKYTFEYEIDGLSTYFEVELFSDGTITFSLNSVEGDHILVEKGNGRYFINTRYNTFNFYGSTNGEFYPDGYSWAEYYSMDKGHEPSAKQLEEYIKEKGHYQCYCEMKGLSLDEFASKMKPVQ